MTDEKLDQILKQALTPEIDDSEIQIRRKARYKHMSVKKVVAAGLVACAALSVGLVGVKSGLFKDKGKDNNIVEKVSNSFVVTAYASEGKEITFEKGKFIPFYDVVEGYVNSFAVSVTEDDENDEIDFSLELPTFKCSGDNIEKITYAVENGTLEKFKYDPETGTTTYFCENGELILQKIIDDKLELFKYDPETDTETKIDDLNVLKNLSKYEVSYNKQELEENARIQIQSSVTKTDDLEQKLFKYNSYDDIIAGHNELLKDLALIVTVTYKDGTTESQTITFNEIYMSNEELGIERDEDYVSIPEWLGEGRNILTVKVE